MLDHKEYTIEVTAIKATATAYDQLDGDWALFYKVARGFIRRVKPEDRQDFLHDLMLAMAKVKAKYEPVGKAFDGSGAGTDSQL